jgi:hypothetical protein
MLAHDWLSAELTQRSAQMKAKPQALQQTLQQWLNDADLACVREVEELAKLPMDEQGNWRDLWEEVSRTRTKSDKTTQQSHESQ